MRRRPVLGRNKLYAYAAAGTCLGILFAAVLFACTWFFGSPVDAGTRAAVERRIQALRSQHQAQSASPEPAPSAPDNTTAVKKTGEPGA